MLVQTSSRLPLFSDHILMNTEGMTLLLSCEMKIFVIHFDLLYESRISIKKIFICLVYTETEKILVFKLADAR